MEVLKKSQKISKKNPKQMPVPGGSGPDVYSYQFGAFRLDERERLLFRDNSPVPLTPKVFDILLLLVKKSGSVVSKETLFKEIWPHAFVEEANLSVNVATLRKSLREGAEYIETVPRRGYRFKRNVVRVQPESMLVRPSISLDGHKQRASDHDLSGPNSLAVLPFENGSADPNVEYLSDGLTESIISGFSHLENLRVVARNTVFRFKGRELDPQEVGRALGVNSILTGRILRLDNRLIIRAELVDVSEGFQIWGEQYHRELSDLLVVQEEISQSICSRLCDRLTRAEIEWLGKRYTQNTEAYRLYLKGRYHWNKYVLPGLRKAIDYFQQAIEIDPTYALAYAGLADTYYRLSNIYAPNREAMPKARAAALKALEIDETLSEAHASLGLIKMFYEWDWPGAKKEFERAIEINPNNALAHQRFGLYFDLVGQAGDAIRELTRALEIDPLSLQISQGLALAFLVARDYRRALEEIQRTLEMDGNYHPAVHLLGRIYELCGQIAKAIAAFKKVVALNDAPMFLAALGRAYALAGRHSEARSVLSELRAQSKTRYVSEYNNAAIYLALGDKDRAIPCLEAALENHCEMMCWLKVDPILDSVRTDLRFTKLLRRVALDREYGKATGLRSNDVAISVVGVT
jgi:TolB-like protein/Tfp pilus assembly protein PilF